MKALLAAFAVAVVAAFTAGTPASAQTADDFELRCLVVNQNDRIYNICTCKVEQRITDERLLERLRAQPARLEHICPGAGGGGGSSSSTSNDDPHDKPHGKSFSKASSSSKVLGIAVGGWSPFALNVNSEHTKSFATGNGEAAAGAGAGGVAIGGSVSGIDGGVTFGGTGGSSCAGNGCNSNPNVGNPAP